MIVTGAFQFLSAPLAGALSKKLDLRIMLAIGLSLFGVGLALTFFVTSEWGFWELFLPQAVRGISLMLCFVPINTLALGRLPHEELHNASGLYNLMRNLGGAIGLAAINTLLIERLDLHKLRLSESLTAARETAVGALEGLSLRLNDLWVSDPDLAALKLLKGLVTREAMTMTFGDAFLALALVFGTALLFMPLVEKVNPNATPADGGH
jgi:DHA2 family multidrug resistance protein